jgi:phospholipase C
VLYSQGEADFSSGEFTLHFANSGKAAAVFQVRSGHDGIKPRTYTVEPGVELSDTWPIQKAGGNAYDLSVYGPNGFLRTFKGRGANAILDSALSYDLTNNGVTLQLRNRGNAASKVRVLDVYAGKTVSRSLASGEDWQQPWPLNDTFGWYDLVIEAEDDPGFRHQLAGHLESGKDSTTDPAIGAVKA